jgi:hypothetical protein
MKAWSAKTKDGSVMSSTATAKTHGGPPDLTAAGAFTSVLDALVGSAAAKVEQKAASWADKGNGAALADKGLDELAAGSGAKERAGAEAVKAGLHGKNPVWAAIKGAWQAGTPVVRAAVIAALTSAILLLLLSPVPLIVFLVSLLIIAAVHRARAAKP